MADWDVTSQTPASPSSGDWSVVSHQPAPSSFDLGDIVKSGATGLMRGVSGMADMASAINPGTYLANAAMHGGNPLAGMQSTETSLKNLGVSFHDPQTTAGHYAETVGEFAPAAIGGPEGILPKIGTALTRAVIPALASEGAGQLTKGTAFEPVARLAGALLGGGIGGAAEHLPSLVKPASDVEKANAYLLQKLQSSGYTPSSAMSAAQTAEATGKPLTAAEIIGKPAEVAVGALARRPGVTADALGGAMASRSADANNRILGDYAASAGINPAAAQGDIDGLVQSGQAQAGPLFDAVRNTPGPIWNSDLQSLANRKVIKQAISDAADNLDAAGKHPGVLGLPSGPNDKTLMPTAEAWELVRRNLGSQIERDPFGKPLPDSQSPNNYNIGIASRDLTGALKKAIPGLSDALDVSGDYLSSKSAFQRGQDAILNSNITAKQVADHVTGLSSSQLEAYKGGIANKLFNITQNNRLNLKLFDAPIVQQKLSSALGPQNAQKFLDSLKVEKGMANFARTRVPGAGSPTAEYNAEMSAQDTNPVAQAAVTHGGNIAQHGVIGGLMKSAAGHIGDMASAFATRGMSTPARDEAGRILMMSPQEFQQYLAQITKSGQVAPRSTSALPYFAQGLIGGTALANQGQQ